MTGFMFRVSKDASVLFTATVDSRSVGSHVPIIIQRTGKVDCKIWHHRPTFHRHSSAVAFVLADMGPAEETQTQQPSWHVQAQKVGDATEASPNGDIPTSSIPPESLFEGGHGTVTEVTPGEKPGSQGLSTLPAFPIPLEMSFQSNDMRSFESGDTSSELFTLPPRSNAEVDGGAARVQADHDAAAGEQAAILPTRGAPVEQEGPSSTQQDGKLVISVLPSTRAQSQALVME
jgi:hypothetical protein